MASALQKLLRRSQPARIIAALHPPQTPKDPVIALHRECHPPTAPIIEVGPETGHSRPTVVFPSFPFGFVLKPVFASGLFPVEGDGAGLEEKEEEDSRAVWADSVKKKRKRKMNKHKYQKLRKRMRRQS